MVYLVKEVKFMKRNMIISILIVCSSIIIYFILAGNGLTNFDSFGLIIISLLAFIISLLMDIRNKIDKQNKRQVRSR